MNLSQNSDFNIVSSNEVASIICRFTPEMITDLVQNNLSSKYRSYTQELANIVASIETNYRMAREGLPEYSAEISSQRYNTYTQIIQQVCQAHQLQFTGINNENIYQDIYSAAYTIYDFLVSRYTLYLVNFFTNYINREKNMLYETLELASKRKEASPYSKKIYKSSNSKLAIIHANLEYVIQAICSYDIDFETYVDLAYIPDRVRSRYLLTLVVDNGDFFKRYCVPYIMENFGPITTQIKFSLQELAVAEFNDLT